MKKNRWFFLVPVIAAASLAVAALSEAQFLQRLTADFKNFNRTETATAVSAEADGDPDGVNLFTKTVFVPPNVNTLYVTISATGDTHNGAAIWLSCRVDGVFCNPGTGGAGQAPPGWIALQKHLNYGLGFAGDGGGGDGDAHDNSLYYTWCMPVKESGPKQIAIKMASSGIDNESPDQRTRPTVFIEAAHFYVDANQIFSANRCRGR